MDDTSSRPHASPAAVRRAIVACGIGQVFELYDFVIYGLMAGALSHAFFPAGNETLALLNTFATFAVGFVMRPVGAVVIGAYGDRHGCRAALAATIGARSNCASAASDRAICVTRKRLTCRLRPATSAHIAAITGSSTVFEEGVSMPSRSGRARDGVAGAVTRRPRPRATP